MVNVHHRICSRGSRDLRFRSSGSGNAGAVLIDEQTEDAPIHVVIGRMAVAFLLSQNRLSSKGHSVLEAAGTPECQSRCCGCRRIILLSKPDAPSPGWECPTFVERTAHSLTSRMILRSCRAPYRVGKSSRRASKMRERCCRSKVLPIRYARMLDSRAFHSSSMSMPISRWRVSR